MSMLAANCYSLSGIGNQQTRKGAFAEVTATARADQIAIRSVGIAAGYLEKPSNNTPVSQ